MGRASQHSRGVFRGKSDSTIVGNSDRGPSFVSAGSERGGHSGIVLSCGGGGGGRGGGAAGWGAVGGVQCGGWGAVGGGE